MLAGAFVFTGCNGADAPTTESAANYALRSALSQYGNSTEATVLLTKDDALTIVTDCLNSNEDYDVTVNDSTVQSNGKEYYIVTVSLAGSVLAPCTAVDASTGNLYSYYDDKSIGDLSDLPYLKNAAAAKDWAGNYLRDDKEANMKLTQSDSKSFEFVLEVQSGGVTTNIHGTAEIDPSTGKATFTGNEGLVLNFVLEGSLLTVSAGADNMAADAGSYSGDYLFQEE